MILGSLAAVRGQPAGGNCCLWRINKSFDGTIQSELGTPHACETGRTTRSRIRITFRVLSSGGPSCDQAVTGFPPNSQLRAEGSTLHRGDGLAHFSATALAIPECRVAGVIVKAP